MARKQPEKPKMPATAETKLRPVRIDLPPEDHRLLRLVAADEEMSMAAFARDWFVRNLREEAKRRGIRP